MKQIPILTVYFDCEISPFEVHLFRGAVIKSIGDNADILYHNHHTEGDGFRYSYPLIQYKRIGGKAAIVCVGEGVEQIGQFLSSIPTEYQLGNHVASMQIEKVHPQRILMQTWDSNFTYTIRRWLPLNSENYKKYNSCESLVERIQLLEHILLGNILSMGKGLGIHYEKEVKVSISEVLNSYMLKNKETKLMAFDVKFTSNVSLPDYVGLGKNASIGYGVVKGETKEEKK